MKKATVVTVLIAAYCLLAMPVFAQSWTAEEQEVWSFVESITKQATEGKVDEFAKSFHKDFVGWSPTGLVPDTRADRVKMLNYFVPQSKSLFYELRPLSIKVHGNFAVVHYIFNSHYTRGSNPPESSSTKWTDVYMKENGKWQLVADHGSSIEFGDDDD
jgi:ketosteroid isomerase-like protein